MIQAGVSNLPTDLESASTLPRRRGQAEGRQEARSNCSASRARPPPSIPRNGSASSPTRARTSRRCARSIGAPGRCRSQEWRQYWAFEHINRRGVAVDVPFVERAAALAAEDGVASGRRLAELTDGVVTKVTQAKRLASWLCDQLPDAAMREVLTIGVLAETADDDEENGEAEAPELSLTRDRVARVLAMLEAKAGERRPVPERDTGPRSRDLAPLRRRRQPEEVRAPRRAAGRRRAARSIQLRRRRTDRAHELEGRADPEPRPRRPRRGRRARGGARRHDRRRLLARGPRGGSARRRARGAETRLARQAGARRGAGQGLRLVRLVGDRGADARPGSPRRPSAEKVLDVFRANDADPTRPDIYTIAAAGILHKDPSTDHEERAQRRQGRDARARLRRLDRRAAEHGAELPHPSRRRRGAPDRHRLARSEPLGARVLGRAPRRRELRSLGRRADAHGSSPAGSRRRAGSASSSTRTISAARCSWRCRRAGS